MQLPGWVSIVINLSDCDDTIALLQVLANKEKAFYLVNDSVCIKVGISPSKKIIFIYFNKSLLKILKNAFNFMLKAIFVLEILIFLPFLFGYVEKRLDKKAMVKFKIYDSIDKK